MSHLLHQAANLVAFVRSVEAGSFSAASRITGTTPSAVSKSIARLEAELGVRLFRRSTRQLDLTPDGLVFFNRVAPLLRDLDDSADAIRPEGEARGRLRVSMPSDLGRLLMQPLATRFVAAHPGLELDMVLVDRPVDVVGEGFDVVFRVGHPAESDLRSRLLAQLDMALVASPTLLATHGTPSTVDELRELPFVRYLMRGRSYPLTFDDGSTFVPRGPVGVDTGVALREAAIQGVGVGYLMACTVQADIDAGRLVRLLSAQSLPSLPLHALHAFGRLTPVRVKRLTEFVAAEGVRFASGA